MVEFVRSAGLLLVYTALSISASKGQYLNAGDQFPDIVLTDVKNWKDGVVDFRDLRGKLVVLDFWTVYCAACIQDMPEMEKLQETYADAVQIILVTSSTQEEVARLRGRSATVRSVSLPMVLGDTLLNQLFSFRTVPTHVWIDEEGFVAQVTGPYTTDETLRTHLDGVDVKLPQKKENKDFDFFKPLLRASDGRYLPQLEQYSAVFKRINDDVGYMGVEIDPVTRKVVGTRVINQPIVKLYASAYASDSIPFDHQSSRVVLEVSDSSKYFPPPDLMAEHRFWKFDNTYCYESYLPNTGPDGRKKAFRLALDQYFGLAVTEEKRMVECYVLRCIDESRFQKSLLLVEHSNKHYSRSFKEYCSAIRAEVSTVGRPMIIDYHYEGDIIFPVPDFDGCLSTFNDALKTYGLEIKKDIRELNMMVIRD